jgi:hypothetical protein
VEELEVQKVAIKKMWDAAKEVSSGLVDQRIAEDALRDLVSTHSG